MITEISASNAYAQALSSIRPETEKLPQGMTQAAAGFAQVMDGLDTAATGAMTGKADTHDVVQAIARAALALESGVAIRDKVVEAYQEILRMPV